MGDDDRIRDREKKKLWDKEKEEESINRKGKTKIIREK